MQDCFGAQVVRDLGLTARRFTLSVMDGAVSVSDLDRSLHSLGGNSSVCRVHQHRVDSLCLDIPVTRDEVYGRKFNSFRKDLIDKKSFYTFKRDKRERETTT